MQSKKIAIIGGGNLGTAIAEGLISSDFISPADIMVTKRNTSTLAGLMEKGAVVSDNNIDAVRFADVVILAVKPFQVKEILLAIKDELVEGKHSLVSVVTGVFINDMDGMIEKRIPMFRAMPNTAIAISESMTCICHQHASNDDICFVSEMFDQLGKSVTIDEKLMDASTVLGACGTAFAMRYIRANIQGGIEIGFDAETASIIAAQTVKGCSRIIIAKAYPSRTGN